MRLYFKIDRLHPQPQCDDCPKVWGTKYKKQVYHALSFVFDKDKHLLVNVIRKCIDHIPGGSWIEGISKPTRYDDPQEQKSMEKIWRYYKVG